MNIFRHISHLLLLAALPASAQLHESVNVEGTYLRDVLHPDRINQLPALSHFRIADSSLEYALQGVPAGFSPSGPALAATAWGADRSAEPRLGYLDISSGSWLNSALYFGLGILRQPDQRLDLRLQHNSTSLWRPFGESADPRISYDENIGLSYARRFREAGTLSVSAQYHLGYFNYYGIDPNLLSINSNNPHYRQPTQTLNDAAFKADWNSLHGASPLDWHASAGARYFATRTATRETDISLAGGVAKEFGGEHRAGIDAYLNLLLYSEARGGAAPDNYTALSLNPFYRWRRRSVQFRIGADLDLTFNADGSTPGTHFGAFHAAPDIRFDVTARNVGFYIHLTGGTELHTLASMWQLDPYRNPHLESTMPVYTPLDAVIGGEFTPFRGFSAGVALRYKVSRNLPMEGWYMACMNGPRALPDLQLPAGVSQEYGMGLDRYNLSGFGVELKLRYHPSRVFDIHASGSYTPQSDTDGIFNGLDRPRWVADGGFEVEPVRRFRFGADVSYRGVRRVYTCYYDKTSSSLSPGGSRQAPQTTYEMFMTSLRLPDICRLSAHAEWDITPALTVRLEADNLLNRRFEILPCTPTEGITITGGLQWLF